MEKKLPIRLQIASTISTVWGVLLFISSIGMVIPIITIKEIHLLPIVQLIISIVYYTNAKSLRQKNKSAGIINLLLSIPVIFSLIYFRYGVAPIGISLCLIMNLFVLLNWKYLSSKATTEEHVI